MKILVCMKQVPESSSWIVIDEEGKWIDDTQASFRMNRYDEHALEEALKIKDILPEANIHALTIGPKRASAVVRRAIEMGADEGFHYTAPAGFLSPNALATVIVEHTKKFSYDLILCGVMSEDAMQAQTGPTLAAMLDIPFVASVISLQLLHEGGSLAAERETGGAKRQRLEISLPCLLTVQTGINHPRYPTLSNVLRAKRQPVHTHDAGIENLSDSTFSLTYPENSATGEFLEGSPKAKAARLACILREHSLIRGQS
jgi:electron transfer flavoprotein beta subunit